MTEQQVEVLGQLRRPVHGWDQTIAVELNDLVRRSIATFGWQRLVVMMHDSAWRQVHQHLNYNVGIPRPGIPMGGPYDDDLDTIVVVLKPE
ncbi:MAG: hypothetical protein U0031_17960 [Thermomicrobiales bacterium]